MDNNKQRRRQDGTHEKVAVVHPLHERDARAGLDVLRGVLPGGQEDGRHDVRGVRVEAAESPGHGTADEVLLNVGLHHRLRRDEVVVQTRD